MIPPVIVVLLVDDQPFVATAIRQLVGTEADIEFQYSSDPLEAVDLANRLRPAVIRQDLVMPGMDGLALLQAFRSNPSTARTPIIVLSGTDDTDACARASALGATDFLVKLPTKAHLLDCIRGHAAGASGGSRTDADVRAATPARPTEVTLDARVIESFREADALGGSAFTATLIDQFLGEARSEVMRMREAVQQRDIDSLKLAAHALRGSSATIGARNLSALCAQMERHAAHPIRVSVLSVLMSQIEQESVRLQETLALER